MPECRREPAHALNGWELGGGTAHTPSAKTRPLPPRIRDRAHSRHIFLTPPAASISTRAPSSPRPGCGEAHARRSAHRTTWAKVIDRPDLVCAAERRRARGARCAHPASSPLLRARARRAVGPPGQQPCRRTSTRRRRRRATGRPPPRTAKTRRRQRPRRTATGWVGGAGGSDSPDGAHAGQRPRVRQPRMRPHAPASALCAADAAAAAPQPNPTPRRGRRPAPPAARGGGGRQEQGAGEARRRGGAQSGARRAGARSLCVAPRARARRPSLLLPQQRKPQMRPASVNAHTRPSRAPTAPDSRAGDRGEEGGGQAAG